MSANRELLHLVILPEDDANRQIANGFLIEVRTRQLQALPPAGGWREVLKRFKADHVTKMYANPTRLFLLLIDFDGQYERFNDAKAAISPNLIDRVFILGAWTEPEKLKADLGSFETIGRALAKDCRDNTNATWGHDLLRHNAEELARLCGRIRALLSAD